MKKKVLKSKPSKSKKNKTTTIKNNKIIDNEKILKVKSPIILKKEADVNKYITKNKKPLKEKKDHYVDSNKFKELIVESYKTEVISEELADSICKIANKLSFHPRFINYTYKEEMVGDAIEKMLKAVTNKKYDPNLGNAFAYFTRITYNAFFNRINKEKKEKEFVLSLQDVAYTDMENAGFETITDEYPEEKYYE